MTRRRVAVEPPATIGMLGGGQLGRYALIAARIAGYRTIVLDPDPQAPAGRIADVHLVARFDDVDALDRLAASCAVVTTEFENPPAAAMHRLETAVTVAPSAASIEIAQDRITEKTFLVDHGFDVAPWIALVDGADVARAATIGTPAIVKSARLGYDGKGQVAVAAADGIAAAWSELGEVRCVVERRVPLDAELSALVARGADGRSVVYPIAENHHRDGILDLTVVPARVDPAVAEAATVLGRAVADALDFVGVVAIELFVSGGRLLVNEIAPRPHNSGHWTLDAARTDQFSQQIRAVTAASLGDTSLTVPAVAMVNLLGELWRGGSADGAPDWSGVLADRSARLHIYGKAEPRRGRKMGHLTVLGDDADDVAARALRLRETVAASRTDGSQQDRSVTFRPIG